MEEGAKVVLGDILDEQGQQVEAEINELGGDALYVHLDVTSEADWESAVEAAVSRFGKLDILVNNAAIVIQKAAIEDRTGDEWDRASSRGEREGRVPRHEARHPGDAKGGRRLNRQYIVGGGHRAERSPRTGIRRK